MNLFARCSRLPLFAAALGSLACSGPVTDESGDGSVQGKFVETVAHYDDGTNTVSYALRVNGDRRNVKELTFETAPDLKQLTEIKVWGTEDGDRIRVERYELVDHGAGLGTRRESLINAPPIPTTSMVMVMVNVGTGTGSVTVQSLTEDLFGNDPSSLKNYYLENSFGMHALTGQVMPTVYQATLTTCDTDQLADGLRAQVLQAAGVPEFDLYLWYFGRTSVCTWSGLSSGEDTFYNGSSGCVVLAQEPGHSFGFSHSSSLECHDASGNVVSLLDDPNQCTHNEYGNRYDTMGGGCRHFSAYQKVYRSYLQKCNGVNVRSSGTFTLHPIETPCDATQVLQVPMPHVRSLTSSGGGGGERTTELMHYLVELRSPIGFDASMVPSVLINAAPDYRVFDPSIGRGNRGQHIWLLDMAPAVTGTSRTVNGSQHALAAGATFTDPAGGVSITTESVSATSATIRVEIANGTADPTCLDGTPFTAPGPASCGAGGAAGTAGTAGAPGAGGSAGGGAADSGGAAGSAGQPAGGTGAVPGAGGTNLTPPKDPAISLDEHGGCACRVRAERSGRDAPRSSLIGLALLALSWRRAAPNRRARAGDPIKPRSARRTG